jgi:hypothetical protein
MRINSSGNILVSKYNGAAASPTESADWPTPVMALRGYGNYVRESMLSFGYANDAAYQTVNPVWNFRLAGTASATASSSATDLELLGPGDLVLGSGGTESMRITSAGAVLVGKTSTALTSAGVAIEANGIVGIGTNTDVPMYINRQGNDGTLIELRQGNTAEGTISVSGTTVSYNGGHLARWSQLADNTRDDTILKGTVLTNLDQMAVWGDEDNEQLNCMAKSSVEGDANVAGVFVNWDNDDDVYTNDMNVAMTGDMIIRIAQGTTVARGDLLMSAGDGTAKPQGDDSVRSKTIAKVTSTHTTCTYDDGSYCVPCVLMAC